MQCNEHKHLQHGRLSDCFFFLYVILRFISRGDERDTIEELNTIYSIQLYFSVHGCGYIALSPNAVVVYVNVFT